MQRALTVPEATLHHAAEPTPLLEPEPWQCNGCISWHSMLWQERIGAFKTTVIQGHILLTTTDCHKIRQAAAYQILLTVQLTR